MNQMFSYSANQLFLYQKDKKKIIKIIFLKKKSIE